MINIDFSYNKKSENTLNNDYIKNSIFRITPITAKELEENLSSKYPLYEGSNYAEYKEFFKTFWLDIQKWTSNNLIAFNKQSIKIATFHLSSHFAMNYYSTKKIIQNLIKNDCDKGEFNLFLSDDMAYIDGDWSSSFISFLACINTLEEFGSRYNIDPSSTAIFTKLIAGNTHVYFPLESYKKLNRRENNFFEKINKAKFLSYTLMDRLNFLKNLEGSINILPKSVIELDNVIGIYNQFNQINLENTKLEIKSWQEFALSKSQLAINIETNYFDSLGRQLFEIFSIVEEKILIELKDKNIEVLLIDEIVDIESLPLLSACSKSGVKIHVTQHSSDSPIDVDLLDVIPDTKNIFTAIWPTNNYSSNFFSKYNLPIQRNPITERYDFRKNGDDSQYVILIENDLIRKFGIRENLGTVTDDLTKILNHLVALGVNKYIWRQRCSDNMAVLDLIQKRIPEAQIIFDPQSLSIDDLSKLSKASIGFGSNSSFCYQLAIRGVVNFFASNKFSEFEYVADINKFHDEIGFDYCLSKLPQVLSNKLIYSEMLAKQQSFIESL